MNKTQQISSGLLAILFLLPWQQRNKLRLRLKDGEATSAPGVEQPGRDIPEMAAKSFWHGRIPATQVPGVFSMIRFRTP